VPCRLPSFVRHTFAHRQGGLSARSEIIVMRCVISIFDIYRDLQGVPCRLPPFVRHTFAQLRGGLSARSEIIVMLRVISIFDIYRGDAVRFASALKQLLVYHE
jgi:hypothetical protein